MKTCSSSTIISWIIPSHRMQRNEILRQACRAASRSLFLSIAIGRYLPEHAGGHTLGTKLLEGCTGICYVFYSHYNKVKKIPTSTLCYSDHRECPSYIVVVDTTSFFQRRNRGRARVKHNKRNELLDWRSERRWHLLVDRRCTSWCIWGSSPRQQELLSRLWRLTRTVGIRRIGHSSLEVQVFFFSMKKKSSMHTSTFNKITHSNKVKQMNTTRNPANTIQGIGFILSYTRTLAPRIIEQEDTHLVKDHAQRYG
jgi:hypothetical protein